MRNCFHVQSSARWFLAGTTNRSTSVFSFIWTQDRGNVWSLREVRHKGGRLMGRDPRCTTY